MEKSLYKLIDEFGQRLTIGRYNQYIPKLQGQLIPYILENKANIKDIGKLFRDEFTPNDVVSSAVYYVKNNYNVESISAVDDFLIAINRLFDEILFERYPNLTLMKYKPFVGTLGDEVRNTLKQEGIELKEKEAFSEIDEEKYRFILQYLSNVTSNGIKPMQVKIIIKLYLLYGLSCDRVSKLKISDYNAKHKTLGIAYNLGNIIRYVHLELPYSLSISIDEYLELRRTKDVISSEYLFVTKSNSQIDNAFLKNWLDKIRKAYTELYGDGDEKNSFTPTGLQKHAIIKMILNGVNQSIVLDITDQGPDIYDYCQEQVNINKRVDKNRYVNHMVRGIDTFDEI